MKRIIIITSIAIAFISCKKDPVKPIVPMNECQSTPSPKLVSTPGSYFVYQWYEIDSMGTETILNIYDTLTVIGDTIINGNTFTKRTGNSYIPPLSSDYVRDSSGYIVNQNGLILYSYNNSNDTVKTITNSLYTTYVVNQNNLSDVFYLPIGKINEQDQSSKNVNSFDLQGHYYNNDNTPYTNCDVAWINHKYFVDGIGEVISQSGYISEIQISCKYKERRLIYYNIK